MGDLVLSAKIRIIFVTRNRYRFLSASEQFCPQLVIISENIGIVDRSYNYMLHKKIQEQLRKQYTANLRSEDIRVCENMKYLPVYSHPSHVEVGLLVLCTKGTAKLSVYGNAHVLVENEMAIIFPGQLVTLSKVSDDFLTDTLIISQSLFDDAASGITRFSPHFFFYMRSNYWHFASEKDISCFSNYFTLIQDKISDPHYRFKREAVIHVLRVFYLDVYNDYCDKAFTTKDALDVRKGELAHNFFYLLMEHYKKYREVAYYADKMCITPKYLSAVIKEVSGKTARDWIVDYMILEIKTLLRDSSLTIQEIAGQTNFSNQSSLGRFFRKYTGMTLTDYRIRK